MAIDWFTVTAQIVNFLILVWLLKKLLFRPIMNAMERRELGISGRLQQAHRQMDEAETMQQKYQQHLQQLQSDKEALIAQARAEAENEKTVLLQRLNEEMQRKKSQFEGEIQQRQQELSSQIGRALAEKTISLSDKVLRQLADQQLEQRMADCFVAHLTELPEQEQAMIKQILQQHRGILMTRFEPDESTKKMLLDWFNDFAPGCDLTFAQRESLVCGIALEAGGHSWDWNIERYLNEVDTALIGEADKSR